MPLSNSELAGLLCSPSRLRALDDEDLLAALRSGESEGFTFEAKTQKTGRTNRELSLSPYPEASGDILGCGLGLVVQLRGLSVSQAKNVRQDAFLYAEPEFGASFRLCTTAGSYSGHLTG